MSKHLGIIHITPQLLSDLLGLPAGTRIVGMRESFDFFSNDGPIVALKVEHKDLPEVDEGMEIKVVTPEWITDSRMAPVLRSWE